jgi:hypothetical protein
LPVSWCFGGNLISISWAAGCPICGLIYSNTPNDLCGKPPKPGHVWCDTDEDGQTNCGPKYARDPINIPKGGSCPAGTRITCCYYFDTTTASYNPGDTCTAADGTTSTVQENTNAATGCKYYSCPSSCFQLNRAGCTGNSPAGTSCQGVNENGQSATGQCTVMTVDGTKCKYGVCTVPHTTTTGYTTNTSNPSTGSGHCSTTCTTTGTYDTCTTYC